jgi:hypothetical protein
VRQASAIALACFMTTAVVASAQTPTTSPPPGTLHTPTRTGAGTATGQPTTRTLTRYNTEAEAKQACAADTVVWANTSSKVLHTSGDKYYGHTKRGAYVCETAAQSAGYHLAK